MAGYRGHRGKTRRRAGEGERRAPRAAHRAGIPDRGIGHPGLEAGTDRLRQGLARPHPRLRPLARREAAMEPVTVADQPAVLDPADADELIGTLLHAAAVIGTLAGHPAAG